MSRIAAACAAAVMVAVLGACGARLDTVLDVAADGSGSRVMTLTLSTDDRDEYVSGGNAALDASIRRHLPPELTYAGLSEKPGTPQGDGTPEESGEVAADFTLEFGSLKEYRAKVASLLAASGETQIPTIDLRIEDTLFLQGVVVRENFTSRDLLAWLEQGLVDDGVVDDGARGNVIEEGDSTVRAAGRTFEAYQPLGVDQIRDVGMRAVTLRTELSDDGQATRTIDYAMGADAYATNPDQFDAFLAEATPAGGDLREGPEVDGAQTWTMTITAPAADLAQATSQALGGGEATFTVGRSFTANPPAMRLTVTSTADCSLCSPQAYPVRDTLVLPRQWQPEGAWGEGQESGAGEYDLGQEGASLTFVRPVPITSAHVTTHAFPDLTFAQTVVLTLAASTDDVVGEDFEAMLSGGDGSSLRVDRGDDAAVYTLTIERASAHGLDAAARAAGLAGLGATGWRVDGDGFFRARLRASVEDPFGGWGVADVRSVVLGAGGLSVDDAAEGSESVVAELSGWKTAGLITLGIIAAAVVALAAAAYLLRARLVPVWRRVRDGARARAVDAAKRGRERAAATAAAMAASAAATTPAGASPADPAGSEEGAAAEAWSEALLR
ncbi:hypothetical protein [Xylanimonas ulmi]|uniref:Uncharacterized protein n=1 Tax=Xylanimonas ulmi TaxID=228973 RepID=A0A4Q7M544_9MICO|nr:hypothetical protein [Xylanibacterium ulmi]RZS62531.1 hypothetical protein EV386_2867 [Xylanibacterium ulmi]